MAERKTKAPTWPATEIVRRKTSELKPHKLNAKKHPPEQVDKIAAAIREWGWTTPILIDARCSVIAGHGRLLAAEKLDIDEVPCVVARGWTKKQKDAYRIADNRVAESEWDTDLLKVELGLLGDFDLGLLGFDLKELDGILETNGQVTEDEVPEPPDDPTAKQGDLWALGEHRVLCGDSTDPKAVRRLPGKAKPFTVTDPPYGIGYEYEGHRDDPEKNGALVAEVLANCPAGRAWTPGPMNLARDLAREPEAKVLVWHKKFAARSNGLGGASTWEPILVVGARDAHLPNDYLEFPTEREQGLREKHSCPKPVRLWAHLIASLCGRIVFDPFLGSGTTLIAAEQLGRTCYGIEIEPRYVDVIVERWQNLTGKKATLEATGATLEATARKRKKKK